MARSTATAAHPPGASHRRNTPSTSSAYETQEKKAQSRASSTASMALTTTDLPVSSVHDQSATPESSLESFTAPAISRKRTRAATVTEATRIAAEESRARKTRMSTHSTRGRYTAEEGEDEEEREVFVEAPSPASTRTSTGTAASAAAVSPSSLQRLQGTPTSQLLSQLQDLPYAAVSGEHNGNELAESHVEHPLFTPVTVARQRLPVVAENEEALIGSGGANPRPSIASTGSRSSVHDEAVQAILRANPPTTTRAVELKPGYRVPSPRTPLWAALDADDTSTEGRPTRGSTASEQLQSNTQVSLFQEDEDLEDGLESGDSYTAQTTTNAGAGAAAAPRPGFLQRPRQQRPSGGAVAEEEAELHGAPTTTTHERRRFGTRRAGNASISLPAPGRSLNLLDEDGLHGDEQLPLFVDSRDTGAPSQRSEDGESFVFSLTQEAMRQERAQDQHAALPRSRVPRATASAVTAAARTAPFAGAFHTPSPARRTAARGRLIASPTQRASPFSQLQRDVENGMAAAADLRSASPVSGPGAATTASSKPATILSQKELRRRADMLKWAERTRAYFHFIDSLPLHVSNSPAKPSPAAAGAAARGQPRRSRSQVIVATAPNSRRPSTTGTTATSMSLVRRSHSTVRPAMVTGRGSAAFAAAISRVKREAATASKQRQQPQPSTTSARTSRPSAP